ncbi:MAG: nucleoside hydrolase [Hellea sp.]|nr:nucleoside hydrolase [Hellea sp.]
MSDKPKLIIDCDPGQDDAINLIMALAGDEFDILGITTVAGNVGLKKVTRNARLICELTGYERAMIFAGASKPLKLPLATAEFIHGKEGLDGIEIFEPALPIVSMEASDFIVEALSAANEKSITLVVTGPMTNIARALQKVPNIVGAIKEIVLMGGAFREGGNMTPSAEFNIYVDPHAAQIVFDCAAPKIVFGLDVTYQVLTGADVIERIEAIDNPVAKAALGILKSYERTDTARFNDQVAPLHDPCTMAYLLKPEIFKLKACNIQVEVDAELTRGHTAVDFWNRTELPKNSLWAYEADRDMFFDLLIDRLKLYGS